MRATVPAAKLACYRTLFMKRALFGVTLLALAWLLLRSAHVGLAGGYLDPAGKIKAQDEALYASSAIHMAESGGWLTPMFMGRYALYKPPLLPWLAGFSAHLLGVSLFSLRLPVALVCALSAGLIFLWVAELASWQAAACAAALLAASRLWCVLGGRCMTDGLLVGFFTGALYCLFSDPWLETQWAFWGFAGAVAASILTKSVAGVLPLAVLGLYWLAGPRRQKPSFGRVCGVAALAAALAAPWFLYELAAHGRWLWTEHIVVELLGFGTGQPPQTSQENRFLFYLLRLALTDPVLVALALAGIPAFFAACRKRSMPAVLLACWMAVVLASVFGWQYRNATYLLPLFPALAILATVYGPFANIRPRWWMLPLVAAAIALKIAAPGAPWGISFEPEQVPVAPALSAYCEGGRGNTLVEVDPVDELYSSALPLPRLRYAWQGQPPRAGRYALDFTGMGIILNPDQFDHLDLWEPGFRRTLREWGLNSGEAIGTVIFFSTPQDVAAMIRAHPESDFFLPDQYRALLGGESAAQHEMAPAPPDHFFLLSRRKIASEPPKWTCRL